MPPVAVIVAIPGGNLQFHSYSQEGEPVHVVECSCMNGGELCVPVEVSVQAYVTSASKGYKCSNSSHTSTHKYTHGEKELLLCQSMKPVDIWP